MQGVGNCCKSNSPFNGTHGDSCKFNSTQSETKHVQHMLQNNFYSVNNYTCKSNWCQTTINDQMSVCTVSTGQFSPVRFKAAFAICMDLQY